MAKTLQDQIKEMESQLSGDTTDIGDENGGSGNDELGDVAGAEPDGSGADEHEAEHGGSEQHPQRGRNRGRRTPKGDGEAPQDDGGASLEDGEASRQSGGRASKGGGKSPDDAGGADGTGTEPGDLENPDDDTSPQAFARLRRQLREASRDAQTLREEKAAREAQQAEQSKPKEPEPAKVEAPADPEPPPGTPAHDKWQIRELNRKVEALTASRDEEVTQTRANAVVKGAIEEFKNVQNEYIKENPDYEPAFRYTYDRYAALMRLEHPDWTPQQVVQDIDWKMLQIASRASREGKNPCDVLYDYAVKTGGYKPGSGYQTGPANDAGDAPRTGSIDRKANLERQAQNRRRSATGIGSSGRGGSVALTRDSIANMTIAELNQLTPDEYAEYERLAARG